MTNELRQLNALSLLKFRFSARASSAYPASFDVAPLTLTAFNIPNNSLNEWL